MPKSAGKGRKSLAAGSPRKDRPRERERYGLESGRIGGAWCPKFPSAFAADAAVIYSGERSAPRSPGCYLALPVAFGRRYSCASFEGGARE
jgi:hypothetical protein